MVSVLMSVYNETEGELRLSVESILNQSYPSIEFIIVLDNPENALLKRVLLDYQKYNDNIVLLFNKRNMGLAESLNKAFSVSKGNYIVRMDADDISYKTRIERQVQFMEEHKEYAIVGTNREDIDNNGEIIKKNRGIITDYRKVAQILKYGSCVTHPSIIIRREVFQDVGGYRAFRSAQDYDLYLRCLLKKYKITNLNEILIQYRIRNNATSVQNAYLQMLTGTYVQKLYKKAKGNCKVKNECLNNDFEKFCRQRGLYNKKKVDDYRKFKVAIKKREYGKLLWIVFINPDFSVYLLRALRFSYMQKKYENKE